MLRVIIIDDEPLGLNTLKVMIERLDKEILVVATSTDPQKGLDMIESYRPDLVFLDIRMPGLSGFELIEKLNFKNFKLVFTTAHKEYAIKAIKNKAYDYLLKPIDANDLLLCIDNVINEQQTNSNSPRSRSFIELPTSDGIILLRQSNIIRLEASGSYTIIYLKEGVKHTASKNLKHFETVLDPLNFFRSHQSHIINLNEVTKIINGESCALMTDQSKAGIGKNSKEGLMQKLKTI
jgi:two-component system LytT family response regulator